MNTAKVLSSVPWGDRVYLLPKGMVYVFSLDLKAIKTGSSLRLEPDGQSRDGLRHLFDQSIVTSPEGLRCEVPTATVEGGSGEFGDPNDPSSCWIKLKIATKVEDSDATLHFETTGVVNLDGGPAVFRSSTSAASAASAPLPAAGSVTGSAFLASVQTTTTGTYRWLERRQIFGVGTVTGKRCNNPSKPADEWSLSFSFDFYAAG
jgi:hypothetical protein